MSTENRVIFFSFKNNTLILQLLLSRFWIVIVWPLLRNFNYIWSYRTQIYNLTSRHQFIIDFKTTHKTMFRISYPIRIKISIPPFLSNDSRPSPLLFLFNFFLLIPCLPMFIFTYNPKSWMGSLNLVFLSWSVKIDTKTPSLLSSR